MGDRNRCGDCGATCCKSCGNCNCYVMLDSDELQVAQLAEQVGFERSIELLEQEASKP